jgi:oligopeptide/dipeptide ABC transporter ATP-binding protein
MNKEPDGIASAVPILSIRGLCKDFRSNRIFGKPMRAVDNVDMEIECGEMRGIVGESGSGKTTLARCSLKLLEPSSGSVCFDGQNLAAVSRASLRKKRRQFQMIFQDPRASLNPAMTMEEILLEPFKVHKIDTRESRNLRLRELLSAVSLSEGLLKRKPGELSGGQQQRAGIARSLALNPRLLIADEPVSSLDASVQAQILNLLSDLKTRYALTLILISHSLCAVHYLCSRISVLYHGRIVEESSASAFFDKPRHPYSRLLLNTMAASGSYKRVEADPAREYFSSAVDTPSGCAFYSYCPQAFDLCRKQVPPLNEIQRGEKVACFLY